MVKVELLEKRDNGIELYEISSEYIRLIVSNAGCRVLELHTPDKDGRMSDVTLGIPDIKYYNIDFAYRGAVIGRVANRIGDARFELNGKEYNLIANNGKNHLHGGESGFDKKIFDSHVIENGIRFHYLSPDMEEGYPGNLDFYVEYTIEDSDFVIKYNATTDKDTVVNFTNHMYFNLSGMNTSVKEEYLQINSSYIAAVDKNCLSTGEFLKVENTPFDFNNRKKLGSDVDSSHEQLLNANGYDHSFILDGSSRQICLEDEITRRRLCISTTCPACQLYIGEFCKPKENSENEYEYFDGVALETQAMPNAINTDKKDSVILKKGQMFESITRYSFDVF